MIHWGRPDEGKGVCRRRDGGEGVVIKMSVCSMNRRTSNLFPASVQFPSVKGQGQLTHPSPPAHVWHSGITDWILTRTTRNKRRVVAWAEGYHIWCKPVKPTGSLERDIVTHLSFSTNLSRSISFYWADCLLTDVSFKRTPSLQS